jgi:hypothetical protein
VQATLISSVQQFFVASEASLEMVGQHETCDLHYQSPGSARRSLLLRGLRSMRDSRVRKIALRPGRFIFCRNLIRESWSNKGTSKTNMFSMKRSDLVREGGHIHLLESNGELSDL